MQVEMIEVPGGHGANVFQKASIRAAALFGAVLVLAGCASGLSEEKTTTEGQASSEEPAISDEQSLAIQLCTEVEALAAADADPIDILVPAIEFEFEVWTDPDLSDLDEELLFDEIMVRCGPVLEGAAADDARWDEAGTLGDLIVVTIESCDEDGASGTITNTSDTHTVAEGWLELSFRMSSGVGYGGGFAIGDTHDPLQPGILPPLGPGETHTWTVDREHLDYYTEEPLSPDEVIVACEDGWVTVYSSDG